MIRLLALFSLEASCVSDICKTCSGRELLQALVLPPIAML